MNKKMLEKVAQHLLNLHRIVNTKRIKSSVVSEIVDSSRKQDSLTDSEMFSYELKKHKKELDKLFVIINYKCKSLLIDSDELEEIYYDLLRTSFNEFEETVNYYFNCVDGIIIVRYKKFKRNKKILTWTMEEKQTLLNTL